MLKAEQGRLECERPKAASVTSVATPHAFPSLDGDRRRAVVETLAKVVVEVKAAHRGTRWTPDRLEVVWRS